MWTFLIIRKDNIIITIINLCLLKNSLFKIIGLGPKLLFISFFTLLEIIIKIEDIFYFISSHDYIYFIVFGLFNFHKPRILLN